MLYFLWLITQVSHCMSAKTGTLLHSLKSDLLGDSGGVAWEVYEKIDLTEQENRGIHQDSYCTMYV